MSGPEQGQDHPPDPQDLVEDYFMGRLSAEEAARLQELLVQDPALRDDFRHAAELDAILRDTAAMQAEEPGPLPRKLGWRPVLAAAACLVLSLGLFMALREPAHPQPLLSELRGSVGIIRGEQPRVAASPLTTLKPDDLVVLGASSAATIAFPNESTRLELLSGARARFRSDRAGKQVALVHGVLKAEVAKQAGGAPLVITTPGAKATVVGTRFSIEAREKKTRLMVDKGSVELAERAGAASVLVERNHFAEVREGAPLQVRPLFALDFSQRIIGVQQKAALREPKIPVVPDLSYGVPPSVIARRMRAMGVNLVMIQVSHGDQQPVVQFVQGLKENAGGALSIVLSDWKWHLDQAAKREELARDLATCYTALAEAGLDDMVKGCHFGENDPLDGKPSTAGQWTKRFDHIVDLAGRLNDKTGQAFTSRSILIHGEGSGAHFKGILAAHAAADFEERMLRKCRNYAFAFQLLDAGVPGPGSSVVQWQAHFNDHCGLDEFTRLGQAIVFVGSTGDGLIPRSLEPGFRPEDGWNNQVRALRKVFRDTKRLHFLFGPMLRNACTCDRAKPVLHHASGNKLILRDQQISDWSAWKNGVQEQPAPATNRLEQAEE